MHQMLAAFWDIAPLLPRLNGSKAHPTDKVFDLLLPCALCMHTLYDVLFILHTDWTQPIIGGDVIQARTSHVIANGWIVVAIAKNDLIVGVEVF